MSQQQPIADEVAKKLKESADEVAKKLKESADTIAKTLKEDAKKQLQLFLDNSMFRTIFESINDGVIVTNTTGNVLFSNRVARAITGLDVIKDNDPTSFSQYFNLYKPDKITPWPANQDPLSRAMQGKTTIGELMFIKNQKAGTFISCMAVPLSNKSADDVTAVVGGLMMFRVVQQLTDTPPPLTPIG